mgnify:CR=1 FL=1
MKNEKKPLIQYTACACFAISAVANVPFIAELLGFTGFVGSKIDAFLMILDSIGKALVAVSIAFSISNIAVVGIVSSFVSLLVRGVQCKFAIHAGFIDAKLWTSGLLWMAFWLLMMVSVLLDFNKKYARTACFAAGLVELLHFVMIMPEQAEMIKEYGVSVARICDILPVILLAVGAILLGMALPEMLEKPKKKEIAVKQPQSSTESKIEQLERLNRLLEKGYITKEEFDVKKDQIMNPKV